MFLARAESAPSTRLQAALSQLIEQRMRMLRVQFGDQADRVGFEMRSWFGWGCFVLAARLGRPFGGKYACGPASDLVRGTCASDGIR